MSSRPWAYERGTLWALDLGAAPVVAAPRVAATCGEVRATEAAALVSATRSSDALELLRRFVTGSRCFVARVDGALAAWGWVSFGVEEIGELERSLRMGADEAYCWDCGTLPAYRRRGLYTALLGHIGGALRAEGMRRLWIGASRFNRPSVRGFATAGFHPAINLTYVRLGPWRHVWVGAHPRAAQGLADAARRALAGPGAAPRHSL
jgi:GNAT superfamily N-acetyltransferase